MAYEGEFASYRALRRVADSERVKQLLGRARTYVPSTMESTIAVENAPLPTAAIPEFVVAIDGSQQEVAVETGYPGANVGYLTVASVLLDLAAIEMLDEQRPVDPIALRRTEQTSAVDAALPGSNVVTRTHGSAKVAFREELYEILHGEMPDAEDGVPLLETYEALLRYKPTSRPQRCPYQELGCARQLVVAPGVSDCVCSQRRPIWSTDALRIHERFRDVGSNGESFGEVMQVWERVLLIHLLRAFERRGLLREAHRLAFFVDGPLALFGHPAWLAAAISAELVRINEEVRKQTGCDLVIVGIEKTGAFVNHFDQVDVVGEPSGEDRFGPATYFLPTDDYIKRHIIYSSSPKRYGEDTYFGRKFFYKTRSGARVVASIPFLDLEQDTLDTNDPDLYPCFGVVCELLEKLVSCRYPNAIAPLVSAHAQAAIPLHLGAKVLEQLAHALMEKP